MADERTIETAIGGAYEMPDGRSFWIDAPVAREMARRVLAALASTPQPASAETVEQAVAAERERCAKIADDIATKFHEAQRRLGRHHADYSQEGRFYTTSKCIAAAIRQSAKGGE
ncbi:hypothetical protein [Rhizorhabdus histidinilytica]|uniref:hypothetical protein n=1 Tax=Rhizorhabdus histidinilytica TaxID=439228 RepID=UPI0009A7A34F|nr:hypothetical protein [Rhizorhabdus histidinilytica]